MHPYKKVPRFTEERNALALNGFDARGFPLSRPSRLPTSEPLAQGYFISEALVYRSRKAVKSSRRRF